MTPLELNSTLSTIVEDAKTKLRELILKAARGTKEIVVTLEDGVEARVRADVLAITRAGQPVTEVEHLIAIAKKLPTAVKADVEAEVAKVEPEVVKVETDVKLDGEKIAETVNTFGSFFKRPASE